MNCTSHLALTLALALVPGVAFGAGAYVEASFVDADLDYAGASSNGIGLRGGYRFNGPWRCIGTGMTPIALDTSQRWEWVSVCLSAAKAV